MKTIKIIIAILFFQSLGISAIKIITLDDAIKISKEKSPDFFIANYRLENAKKSLEATKLGMRSSFNLQLQTPEYSHSLSSQFNPLTGSEEFYMLEKTTMRGSLSIVQPLIFSNGQISINGSIFGREQFSEISGDSTDFFSNLSISLHQPLFSFNNKKASLIRAETNLQKAQRNHIQTEMNLIYNVYRSYFTLYKSKKNMKIIEERVKQTETAYNTALNKFKAGVIAEVEVLEFEIELASSRNDFLNTQIKYEEDKDSFKLLIGLPFTEVIKISDKPLAFSPKEIGIDNAYKQAINNRPEYKNNIDNIKLSEMNLEEIDSRNSIKASLIANYGINKNDDRFKSIFNDFQTDKSIGMTINIPIFDWGKNKKEVEAATASLKILQLQLSKLKKSIFKEIKSAVNNLSAAKKRVQILRKTVEVAQKSYNIKSQRFQTGNITGFEFSQAQIKLTDIKTKSLSAIIDYKIALADLSRKTLTRYY